MADKVVIVMPDSLEAILWIITPIMYYLEDRSVGNAFFVPRPPEKVTIVCKWPELLPFIRGCWKGCNVVTQLSDQDRDEADFTIDFDMDLIYKWSKTTEKHMSMAASFYLGTQILSKFPPLAMVPGIEIPGLVLVVSRRSYMEGHQEWQWCSGDLLRIGASQKITMNALYGNESFEEMRTEVSKASVVVGVAGAATLMGSAMGKVVMELVPDLYHREWVAKWDSFRYRMMYGKLIEFPATFILDRVGRQVKELARVGDIKWMSKKSNVVSSKVSSMAMQGG